MYICKHANRDRPIGQKHRRPVVDEYRKTFWQPLLVGNRLFFTVDRTRGLIFFSVVIIIIIIISFIRRGSDREIYVFTRTYGISSSLLLLIIQFRQIVRIHGYCGCQNAGKLHFLYRLPSKYNIMSYYIVLLLCIYTCASNGSRVV